MEPAIGGKGPSGATGADKNVVRTPPKRRTLRRIAAVMAFFLLWASVEYCARLFTQPVKQTWPMAKAEHQAANGTITTALVGASLVKNGIVPALLDEALGGRAYNYATPNQSMELSYYALKDLAAANPLKLALIDVSVKRLMRDGDDAVRMARYLVYDLMVDSPTRFELLKNCFALDETPQLVLGSARNQLNYFLTSYASRFKPAYLLKYLKNGYVPGVYEAGSMGFTGMDGANPAGGVPFREAPENPTDAVDPETLTSLARIVELCRDKGITPVLISQPTTDTYLLYYAWYETLQAPLKAFAEQEDVKYLDFSLSRYRLDHLTDADFADERHLNKNGAQRFTPYEAEVLKKLLAGEDVSGYFFDSYEEMTRAIVRVSSVGLDVKKAGGAVSLRAFSLQGADVKPSYRFLLKPKDAPDDKYRPLESAGATCALEGIEPGKYTARVEAYSAASSACDAWQEQDIKIS